ncbi:MAG: hypothetical protein ACQESE_02480 [Nanobdellota archaeon]
MYETVDEKLHDAVDKMTQYFQKRGVDSFESEDLANVCYLNSMQPRDAIVIDDAFCGQSYDAGMIEQAYQSFIEGVQSYKQDTGLNVTKREALDMLKEHKEEVLGMTPELGAVDLLMQYK